MIQDTFLKVEKLKNGTVTECHDEQVGCDTVEVCEDVPGLILDKVVARDWDPETRYIWQREGADRLESKFEGKPAPSMTDVALPGSAQRLPCRDLQPARSRHGVGSRANGTLRTPARAD